MTTTARRSKSEQKRQQILLSASDLFLNNSFGGVSMDQVAINAGVSKQTVYSHFGSKEELFSAIIEFKCAIHKHHGDLFDKQRPVHDVLRELAQHFSELLMSPEAISVFRLCVADTAKNEHSKVAELFWLAGPKRLAEHFSHYLEQQNQMGTLHIDQPHFAAQQFLYMIKAEAYLMTALGQSDEKSLNDLPAYLDSCVALFEKAYLD
jgi:TetR/AcrR family transcriptional repressor of mexJK operon